MSERKDPFADMASDALEQEFAGVPKSEIVVPAVKEQLPVRAQPETMGTIPVALGEADSNVPFLIGSPGIYSGIAMNLYIEDLLLAVPSLNAGCARTLESVSPRHAWIGHPRLNPNYKRDEDKKADIGSVAHDLLLEGGTDKVEVIDPVDYPGKPKRKGEEGSIPDGWKNVAIRAARDAAYAEGKYPILKADYASVTAMLAEAHDFIERSRLRGILSVSEVEATLVWQEGPTWFRARPDLLARDRSILVHYKTCTGKVHPDAFPRIVDSQGYDFTMMFYARGLLELDDRGAETEHFILAQEQSEPFSCCLFDLEPPKASIASGKVDRAIQTWARCMASGRWPAYATCVHSIAAKPWDIAKEEERSYLALGEIEPLQAEHGVQA